MYVGVSGLQGTDRREGRGGVTGENCIRGADGRDAITAEDSPPLATIEDNPPCIAKSRTRRATPRHCPGRFTPMQPSTPADDAAADSCSHRRRHDSP
jgi:hypothetical protein